MNNVEIWAQAVSEAVRNTQSTMGLYGQQLASINSSEHEDFYTVAAAVVEPYIEDEQACEEYFEYMENNADNWAQWIKQTFGDEWGAIAKVVAEEGY